MVEKLNPFYKFLKEQVPINITSELEETFDSVNNALNDACQLALWQPIPGKQLILKADASFRTAGVALMVLEFPPRTEARLVAESKDAVDWHTRPIATRFHLSLFADERLEFSLCRFNF